MPPRNFDEQVAGAFARNGLNTLLLDIKEGLGTVGADLRHVMKRQDEFAARQTDAETSRRELHEGLGRVSQQVAMLDHTVERIVPLVDQHEEERREQNGVRKFFKKHYVIGAGAIGGVAAGWHQWERLTTWAGKAFK